MLKMVLVIFQNYRYFYQNDRYLNIVNYFYKLLTVILVLKNMKY